MNSALLTSLKLEAPPGPMLMISTVVIMIPLQMSSRRVKVLLCLSNQALGLLTMRLAEVQCQMASTRTKATRQKAPWAAVVMGARPWNLRPNLSGKRDSIPVPPPFITRREGLEYSTPVIVVTSAGVAKPVNPQAKKATAMIHLSQHASFEKQDRTITEKTQPLIISPKDPSLNCK